MNTLSNIKRGLAGLALVSASVLALSATSASAQSADGKDRHVQIINGTSQYMTKFYASNVGTDDWQENILHGRTLAPGRSVNVNIDDSTGYCHYDLRAMFANGAYAERRNVDVCHVETWTLED